MECCGCRIGINKEYNFYKVGDDFYCENCVEEDYITYYSVCGEHYEEDEVEAYNGVSDLIKRINMNIEYRKRRIEYCQKQEKNEFNKSEILYNQDKIKELEKELEDLKDWESD